MTAPVSPLDFRRYIKFKADSNLNVSIPPALKDKLDAECGRQRSEYDQNVTAGQVIESILWRATKEGWL